MASVTEKPQSESSPRQTLPAESQLVDQQIGRTRRALKMVDLSAGLITLAIGVLAYLLTMAVLEHWVIPGGWGEATRFVLFAMLIVGVVVYSWRTFWPLVRRPINAAYAAQAIEQTSPSLKNSLLNLLLLRGHRQEMSRHVYQAIEEQAAQRLSQTRMESVVDRSIILRLGYILVALLAVSVLYRFLSPKDLFSSAGRVLMPWSEIATPSRVQISSVTPGDTKAARGERLKVSAEVLGLEADEPVRLRYSTRDEQIVRQDIPMSSAKGGAVYSCEVPSRLGGGARGGIQQDFSYWIEAGDARSPRYEVKVFARPTMVVNKLRYQYPAYTGFPTREVEHTGDIRAIEGTTVTLFAQANKPIKSAHVDFDADGRRDLLMKANEQQASVSFLLSVRDDRRTPMYQSYALRYQTVDGNQNQAPPTYQIDVQPDYAPEIQLLLPEEPVLEVPLNQEVNFEIEARDPDFTLSQVMLIGKLGGEPKVQEALLQRSHTGRFVGKLRKTPAELGLEIGDVLEYWGVAADNRAPQANLAYSAHRRLRVTDPFRPDQPGENHQEDASQQQGENGDSDSADGEQGEEGQAGGGEKGNAGEGEEGTQGEAGEGQDGEAGENGEQQGGGNAGQGQESEQGNEAGESSSAGGDPSENDAMQRDPTDSGSDEGQQNKISPEGDDDGSAFERIAEHFDEKSGENTAEKSSENTAEGQRGEKGNEDSDSSAADGDTSQDGEPENGQEGTEQDPAANDRGTKGETAPGEEENQGEAPEQDPSESAPADGETSTEQGDSGAGDDSGKAQGSPNPEGAKAPKDKQGDAGDGPEQENPEAPSTARDQKESDSEGGQGGDRSGGDKEGGGQQADKPGEGTAGQNQAADEGAGQSKEQGEGETSDKPGESAPADGKTGESGEKPGAGSEQSNQSGEQPGDGEEANTGPNGDQPPSDPASAGGAPSAGTGGTPTASPPNGELDPGDEANLDYARKQTDLILDRLEDQLDKQEVDKGLLEKLGWTRDELRRFVDRWKNLKAQADESTSPEANDELMDALRSLGLKSKQGTRFRSKITKDKLRDLQDAYRGRVPLEFQEQVNRYLKGTSKSQERE